jgi:acyl phosphate:glycerol-3-phosphate acyltransferase
MTPGVMVISYLLGSIPFGWLIVQISSGKDIRKVESGRTGGTNAMRAAGFWAGLGTALLDMLKSASTVWIARALAPGNIWLEVIAPVLAILGHNYSIFLLERDDQGRLRLRGGAGGAPTAGGAMGLWLPSILIIVPLAALILYGVGYASVATMSAALIASLIFAVKAALSGSPWQYVAYGLLAEILLIWALRPNIRRLIEGKERLVGWRAKRLKKAQEKNYSSSSSSSS